MAGELDRRALHLLSYGLYVVSSMSGDVRNGQIANAVVQVTSDPPRIAVAICRDNFTHEVISKSGLLSVSVLDETTPMRFIGNFGFRCGRDVDKFDAVEYLSGQTGCPMVVDNALAVIEGKVTDRLDVGTHTIFVAEVVSARVLAEGRPLTYDHYQRVKKGKAPKNAPTYKGDGRNLPDKSEGGNEAMQKYVCGVCGYVYDPAAGDPDGDIAPGTAFEDLPDDWTCPVCGASKDSFSPE